MGSRSLQIGGAAVNQAAVEVVEKARELAADLLEADRERRGARQGSRRSSTSPARRRSPGRGRELAQASLDAKAGRSWPRWTSRPRAVRRSRSGRTSPSSKSTPRPARSRYLRHIAVDDAGTILNPLSPRARSTAASPKAPPRPCSRRSVYDDEGNPLTSKLRRLRLDLGRGAAELRDATSPRPRPAERARCQRHRRVRHDRLDAGRAERRRSTRSRISACATSTCRRRRAGVAARSKRPSAASAQPRRTMTCG